MSQLHRRGAKAAVGRRQPFRGSKRQLTAYLITTALHITVGEQLAPADASACRRSGAGALHAVGVSRLERWTVTDLSVSLCMAPCRHVKDVSAGHQQVLDALERTIASGSARIEFRFRFDFSGDFLSDDRTTTRRQAGSTFKRARRWLGDHAWRGFLWGTWRMLDRWTRAMAAERQRGVIDFGAQRCMYGPYRVSKKREEAVLVVKDKLWKGAPGARVERLSAEAASTFQPLWLVDLVRGVTEVTSQARDVPDGDPCTCFYARADLIRAREAVDYDLAVPSGVGRLEDLKKVPVEIWVNDGGHIRRIRHTGPDPAKSTVTLDLSAFGVELPSDWSHLPGEAVAR